MANVHKTKKPGKTKSNQIKLMKMVESNNKILTTLKRGN